MFAAMGIAILLVYLAMVIAFNSLVTPFSSIRLGTDKVTPIQSA